MNNLDKYWEVVQRRVCAKCIDGDGQGNCRLHGEDECALKLHFPRIVEAVLSVRSDKVDPYIAALRSSVCGACKHQSADGTCMIRAHVDCGLDRYFPLVIEAIEEVRSETDGGVEGFGD